MYDEKKKFISSPSLYSVIVTKYKIFQRISWPKKKHQQHLMVQSKNKILSIKMCTNKWLHEM